MKSVFKLFLIGVFFCMQLNIVEAGKQRSARQQRAAARTSTIAAPAFSTHNLGRGTDNTYREKLKRAVDAIRHDTSVSVDSPLGKFVKEAVSVGADDEITGMGNKEQNQIYDKSPVTDEVSLVELGRTLYTKISFNPTEAKRYVKEVFGGILTAQQAKIPSTFFGTYLTNIRTQVIERIPAYHSDLRSYVQSFIDAAKVKAGTSSGENTDLQDFVTAINPPFGNQLKFESPGAAVADLINKLNKYGLSDPKFREHLYTFVTTVVNPLTKGNAYNQISASFISFRDTAIEKGASVSISGDRNRVFLVESKPEKYSLVDFAVEIYRQQYIVGSQHTTTIFTKILEAQAQELPGTGGSASTYNSKLERLSTHVIQRIPHNLKTSLRSTVDTFLRAAAMKRTSKRETTLQNVTRTLKSLGFSSLSHI
jgi:hypothetical protein